MAPCGHIHFHPQGNLWSGDFAGERLALQALFLHEITHVWQAQQKGRYYLPLMRHPFCRYAYRVKDDRPFGRYGLEQQAEIVRHVHLMRNGYTPRRAPPLHILEELLPFKRG